MFNMDKIARLIVKGDTKDVENSLSRLNKGMSGLQKVAGTLGVALSAGAFVGFVKTSLDAVDALAKTSDKLGVTTEALAGLRHAAELTGVGQSTLDMALQRMTRRLAEAAQGSGEAKAALKELGLSAQRLAQLSPDKALAEIAEAMKGVENQSDRVRLSFKLFDSEGVNLVNTLALGKSGLEEMREEAVRFGLAIDRETARKVEQANDAIARLEASARGAGYEIAASLAPAIEDFAETLTDDQFQSGLKGTIELMGDLANVTLGVADAYMQAVTWWGEWSKAHLLANLSTRMDEDGMISTVFGRDGNVPIGLGVDFGALSGMNAPGAGPQLPPKKKVGGGGRGGSGGDKILGNIGGSNFYGAGFWEEIAQQEVDKQKNILQAQIDFNQKRFAEEIEAGKQIKDVWQIQAEDHVAIIEREYVAVKDHTKELSEFTLQAYRNMTNASADFFYDVLDGNLKSFEDYAASFGDMVNRMVANYVAQMAIMKMFGTAAGGLGDGWLGMAINGVGSWFSSGPGGGAAALAQSGPGSMGPIAELAAAAGNLRAYGGPVSANTPYIVGERGPELFVPKAAGNITPNNKLGGSLSVSVVQHFGEPESREFSAGLVAEIERTCERYWRAHI